MALTASLSSVTASDATFSVAGAAAWATVTGRTVSISGIASAAQGGFGIDTSGSTGSPVVTAGVWTIGAAAASTWDTISAAAADKTTANTTFQITYNTAPTADSKVAWTFGETSAATGGTSSSGVPNQVLLKLTTLAASTQSPLSVFSRAVHAFSISPSSTPQILAGNGNFATLPPYSFAAATGTGMYQSGGLNFSASGTQVMSLVSNPQTRVTSGSATTPSLTNIATATGGLAWDVATNSVSIISNSLEQVRVTPGIMAPPSNANTALGTSAIGWKALYLDYTDTATVGNVTINKPSGQVNLGAGGTQLTLTNSLITSHSHIFLSADSAPGNVVAVQFYAVAGSGSATINAVPAVTNQTSIDFLVIGAD